MPRKILILITDLHIGGTPTVVRELAIRLHAPPDVQIHVACLSPAGPVAGQISRAGIPVTALGARTAGDFRAIWRLRRLIRQERFDTLFSFLIHANAAAAVAAVGLDVRQFQSIQHPWPMPRWHWKLQRRISRQAERIIVPSPSVAAAARKLAGIAAEKIVIIRNAVDVAAFAGVPHHPNSPPRAVFIGRLDPIKRIGDLLGAMTILNGAVHLDIYGDGSERNKIVEEIEWRKVGEWVKLRGAVDDPRTALAEAALLVLPSQAEGFGLVLIEAMAAGVPVVASDVPGIRDVVTNGQTGLLIPVASPTALAAAIDRVCLNSDFRQSLIKNALGVVQTTYDWAKVLPMYETVLGLLPHK
ncbi:MAG TPA: glycosyltransferase family 4 protein [Tepidisphaeraceae bacterium]|nr:glycosyltransferase family 4 protein [Tepidisphaeraceae bacterium]